MKNEFIMPIVVLALICLVISGLLGFVNDRTHPVIELAAAQRAETARMEAIPHAQGFVPIEIEGLPRTITQVYGTTNNVGFIFMISAIGYGGEMRLICAIDPDGIIIKTATLAEKETRGIATPVFNQEGLYIGNDRTLAGIDVISGATITFNAYRDAILDAFTAFDLVKGVRF